MNKSELFFTVVSRTVIAKHVNLFGINCIHTRRKFDIYRALSVLLLILVKMY